MVAVINNQVEVAIVGGGLIGMLTAYSLVKTGVDVVIIEKSLSASESSWAGGGILSPLYPWRYPDSVNTLAFKSQQLYPSLAQEIHNASGIDPQYRQCGMHILADDVDVAARQWLNDNKVTYFSGNAGDDRIIKDAVVIPDWNHKKHRQFLYLPKIAQIRNPRFIKSLKLALEKAGVVFSFDNAVLNFIKQTDGLFSIRTEKGLWRAAKLVICAGAWTGKLLSSHYSSSVNIKPIRGQMLLYKAPESLLSSIILAKGKYIIPRKDGHILVGSTMEDVGFNKMTTQAGEATLRAFVDEICPDLGRFPVVKHWAGLRPGSPDGTPFIGEHPEIHDLFVNSGHFRNGVILAPASALLMRDIILKTTPDIDYSAYSIASRAFLAG